MRKKIVLKTLMMFLSIGAILGLSACGSDDSAPNGGGTNGNNYKITLTLNGVDVNDNLIFSLAGTNTNADSNVWKINGQTQSGQIGISLTEDDFLGSTKTYVIESNFSIIGISSGITVSNFAPGTITGSLTIEKNGSNVVNQAVNLTADGDNLIKQYNL